MEAYMVADAAMKKIEEHAKDCKDFRRDLRDQQERSNRERLEMHVANQAALGSMKSSILTEVTHVAGRVDRLYNRAWAVAFTIMGMEGAALIYFIKQFMERVQP
jgi:hypothetical protein